MGKQYHFPEDPPVVTEYTGKVYYFRWPSIGWASFTVCDATGELHVQSDWGNFSYGWSPDPRHLGRPTLTDFLAQCSGPDYVADKLRYGVPLRERKILDREATETAWKSRILSARRDGSLSAALARDHWESAEDILDAMGAGREDEVAFVINEKTLCGGEGFLDWLGERPWDELEWRDSYPITILRDELLPRFLAYLRAERAKEK